MAFFPLSVGADWGRRGYLRGNGAVYMERFSPDFMFDLAGEEWDNLKSQIATSSSHGGRRKSQSISVRPI